jgi:hypothetical protein
VDTSTLRDYDPRRQQPKTGPKSTVGGVEVAVVANLVSRRIAMATSRWTSALLDQATREGDDPTVHPNADELAAQVMTHPDGIRRYNHLLEVADVLLESPALVLTERSALRRHLREFAPEALSYYEPAPAPSWLDEEKLKAATRLWQDNALASIGVLYALSLPTAYLYVTGVPALYETGKLAKHEYVFQRIYETGLFVDAVMDEGGIEVLHDYVTDERQQYLQALEKLDPQGGWHSEGTRKLERAAGAAPADLAARVEEEVAHRHPTQRFLWGRGYLTTKKVRFLHASIRFMLAHPPATPPSAAGEPRTLAERLSTTQWAAWNTEKNGVPINQEQLALVLMSFGYLIPVGLERWGCRISRGHKEAFLHLWRVVGHVLGIRDDLMTDDWDEATTLTATILSRQAGASPYGQHLTVALMDFMRTYLPRFAPGLRQRLPAHFILDQLQPLNPAYPGMILPPEDLEAIQAPVRRVLYAAVRSWIRLYYAAREGIVGRIPFVGESLLSALHRSSEELIGSWRDQFRRRPFDVSGNMAWVRPPGYSRKSEAELERWRRKIFNNLGLAVLSLFVSVALLVALLATAVVPHGLLADKWQLMKGLALGSAVFAFGSWVWMTWRLPRIFASRKDARA